MNIELDGHPDDAAEFVPPARRVPGQLTHWWESEIAHMQHLFARAVAWTATRAWQVTADWRTVRPIISRAVSLDHPMEIQTGMVFALETYCPAADGYSAARIEEEVVVTDTGCEVISLFPAEDLPIANRY